MRYAQTLWLPCLLALALPGCASKDTQAASAAAAAELALSQGRNDDALRAAHEALKARDDVSEYWVLLGRIDTARNDYRGAFDAYANAFELDRNNVDILRLLCQLGLTARQPDKVDQYADQLLLIDSNDLMPLVMKGGASLQRNDTAGALKFAEQALAKAPLDSSALILKARVLVAQGKPADAAQFIETSLTSGGDPASRLDYLIDLYTQAHDRAHYEWTLSRIASAKPEDADTQLTFADVLYQTGQLAAANTAIIATAKRHPNDIGIANRILEIWLAEGPDALSLEQIRTQGAAASLEMKSAYAQFANEAGHPEIARTLLETSLTDDTITADNADARAALAYAAGLQGHRADAMGRLNAILEFDTTQPRALLARARLEAGGGDLTSALEDARNAVTQDPHSATARIILANVLFARHENVLAISTLKEALRAMPDSVRIAAELARWLSQHGQSDAARAVLQNLVRANPVSLRAQRLQAQFDPAAAQAKPA